MHGKGWQRRDVVEKSGKIWGLRVGGGSLRLGWRGGEKQGYVECSLFEILNTQLNTPPDLSGLLAFDRRTHSATMKTTEGGSDISWARHDT